MKDPIIILHGWVKGGKGARYDRLKNLLERQGYSVFVPDLPGFGNNPLKKEELEFEDYVQFAKKYIEDVLHTSKRNKVILIGHSFGGRIAIKISSDYPTLVGKLVLTGASGITHPLPSLKKKIIFVITKLVRPIFTIFPFSLLYTFFRKLIYQMIGEMDYFNAGNLAKTFKNVYQVNIVKDLQHISVPTFLLWGENDTYIAPTDGKFMQENIPNSKLIIIPHATHKLPYENPDIFVKKVLAFIA